MLISKCCLALLACLVQVEALDWTGLVVKEPSRHLLAGCTVQERARRACRHDFGRSAAGEATQGKACLTALLRSALLRSRACRAHLGDVPISLPRTIQTTKRVRSGGM